MVVIGYPRLHEHTAYDITCCKSCNHIRVEKYRTMHPLVYGSYMPYSPWVWIWKKQQKKDGMVYFFTQTKLCYHCVKKRNFWVLSRKDKNLVENFMRLAQKLERIRLDYIKNAVEEFERTLTPEKLERLAPDAIERYQSQKGAGDSEQELILAKAYLTEIEPYLLTRITNRITEHQRKNRYVMPGALDEAEAKIKNFLEKTEGYEFFCQRDIPFNEPIHKDGKLLRSLDEKAEQKNKKLQSYCAGKELTLEAFHMPVEYTRESLMKQLKWWENLRAQTALEQSDAYQKLVEGLSLRVVENDFWK